MLPPLHGMGLGFAQHDINGHRVIVYDGDTRFFHSQLNLFLDDNVGLFLSLNSTGRDGAMAMVRPALFKQFADCYFPAPDACADTAPRVDPNMVAEHAPAMHGHYIAHDRSSPNFLALHSFRDRTIVDSRNSVSLTIKHGG